jgi:hypothetical protein
MRSRRLFIAALFFAAGTTAVLAADRYKVSLTRKDRNLYKVDGTAIWIQTRYCYVYGYGEQAALSASEIVFFDQGTRCDVRRVLGRELINGIPLAA